jgi:chromosomal replication initiator protein
MQDVTNLWETVLAEIELSVSKANFTTWFKNTHAVREEDGVFFVGVPNEFIKDWLATKFSREVLKSIRSHRENIRSVEFIIAKKPAKVVVAPITSEQEKIEKEVMQELPLDHSIPKKNNLNPKYTFETFIIGSFNEVAYSAAQAVIKKPGSFNPLFIYGSTGIGKTHLVQAVGNALVASNPNLNVYYTSSEKFLMDYVSSLQTNRINQFKEKYRTCDVLIMDDIQFFSAGKEKVQEELFHLFNTLHDRNRQLIFSSDKHPNYIVGLEDRLKSRFSAGMTVDMARPEYESRSAILQSKLKAHNFQLTEESIDYIASHVEGNIRELEGIINTLIMQMELRKRELNIQEIKLLIKNNIKPKRNISLEDIVRVVAHFYNLEETSMYEKNRRKEIVEARQVAMYILREDYSISFPHIGKKLGGRDHTTVMHSYEKITRELTESPNLIHDIEQIRAMLQT